MQAPVSDLDLVVKLSPQVKWRPHGASGQCVITSVHISYRDAGTDTTENGDKAKMSCNMQSLFRYFRYLLLHTDSLTLHLPAPNSLRHEDIQFHT